MKPRQAAVLGAVQGAAEVVPVSSSAQLALLPWLLGWRQPDHRTAFAAALHVGSCAGIAFALRPELTALRHDRRRAAALLASCLPAAAAGLVVDDAVERRLGAPGQLAGALAVAGALLWLADRRPQDDDAGTRQLAVAAVAQVAALVPGVSRQGAVLTALRLQRVHRSEAGRTSLLMSLPVTAGAALLPLARADRETLRSLAPLVAAGVPAAAVSGVVAASAWRQRAAQPVTGAAVYRLGLAAVVGARLRRTAVPH